jgi:L-ascorbate metabolism protein UlaG (beta-lactamase superfamily)
MRTAFSFIIPVMLVACGTPTHQAAPSYNFDGERFFNPDRPQTNTFGTFLKWRFGIGEATPPRAEWPTGAPLRGTGPQGYAQPAQRVEGEKLVVTAIGHASFLVQTQGLNILLDPVFAERASPVPFAGPKRITPAAIQWDDLPPIDAILVSHNHYDHYCVATLSRLVARDNPLIILPLNNAAPLKRVAAQARLVEKDWGQTVELSPNLKVTLEPMQHWSARTPWDRRKALWAAMVLQTPAGNIYWVGDSGYGLGDNAGRWFAEAGAKYPNIRLALLPIGAYEPRWFMQYSHMNPTEAVAAFQHTGAQYAVGHHFGVFPLTDEAWDQPVRDLTSALKAANVPATTFRALLPGEVWDIPLLNKNSTR